MSDVVLRVEEVSKRFRIGTHEPYHRLSEAITNLGRNTVSALGSLFTRPAPASSDSAPQAGDFWALRDVSFEIREGEVVGIIGRNGAGKSTLLKILSRITEPTTGRVGVRGRVGSLLEVGTGFHPELTGRENIYLNGAILGMSRREVQRRFDEIVAFAEIDQFLDTPVKRYSSGMYVRLGFAVAAHLDTEILIVDEVLAVGDSSFQKKCLGKMGDVAQSGRTVLFVSHNMAAISSFCTRGIWLERGLVAADGTAGEVTRAYLQAALETAAQGELRTASADRQVVLHGATAVDAETGSTHLVIHHPIDLTIEYENLRDGAILNVSIVLWDEDGCRVLNTFSNATPHPVGRTRAICHVPGNLLNAKRYHVEVLMVLDGRNVIIAVHPAFTLDVVEESRDIDWMGTWLGAVRVAIPWDYRHESQLAL